MLKLKKRGKRGTWQIVGTIKVLEGGRLVSIEVRRSTGTADRQEAARILAAEERRLKSTADSAPKQRHTFAAAVTCYIRAGGEVRYVLPLLDYWRETPLEAIGLQEAQECAATLYPGRKAITLIRQVYTPLNSIYTVAHKAGLCELRRFQRPKIPKAERRDMDYADDVWLAAVLPLMTPHDRAAVLLMSFTGARAGDVGRLRWRNVDLINGRVTYTNTKNGQTRSSALPHVVAQALRELGQGSPDERVMPHGERWCTSAINQALERAADKAGVRRLYTHSVGRHAFAARLLKQGKSLKFVQQAGGWETLEIVAKHYGHLEQSDLRSAVQDSSADLERIMSEPDNVVAFKRRMES